MAALQFRVLNMENHSDDVQWIVCVQDEFHRALTSVVERLAGEFLDEKDAGVLKALLVEREREGYDRATESPRSSCLKEEEEETEDMLFMPGEDEEADLRRYLDEHLPEVDEDQSEAVNIKAEAEAVFTVDDPLGELDGVESDLDAGDLQPEDTAHAVPKKTLLIEDMKKEEFVCCVLRCQQIFSTPRQLRNHAIEHHPESTCDRCYSLFDTVDNYVDHACRRTCKLCHRNFRSDRDLETHMLIHRGERPHMCDLCGSSFRQRGTLSRHKLTHTRENRFECRICGKYLRHKHYLVQHMRVHTGQKPYVCDLCDKSFTQRSNLVKHKKKHHSCDREHTCPFCKKGFIGEYYLSRHLLTHKEKIPQLEFILPDEPPSLSKKCYGLRNIRCGQCTVTVKSEENLRKHMEEYH